MSQCQGHVAAATQWDALWGQTPGVTVHWSVCNHCVSHIQHQLCLSGTWNPDNLLYLYYLTVTQIGMLKCCILNTILWLSQQNQVNRLCLCMWQRGVWTSQVKCAAGTSSRMIYLFYFTDLCLSVVSAVCMLRALQIILSHTWPLIAFVSRGLRGLWPVTTHRHLWNIMKQEESRQLPAAMIHQQSSVFCRY